MNIELINAENSGIFLRMAYRMMLNSNPNGTYINYDNSSIEIEKVIKNNIIYFFVKCTGYFVDKYDKFLVEYSIFTKYCNDTFITYHNNQKICIYLYYSEFSHDKRNNIFNMIEDSKNSNLFIK